MFLDYYQILDLKKTATADEIRSAFRNLAHKYHPDKNQNSIDSEVIFRSIHEAYRILSTEDLFSMKRIDFNRQKYNGNSIKEWLLTILYFLDKWVLTSSGFGDYFYEARLVEGKEVYNSVKNGFSPIGHNPYISFTDYFFQLRKRMDKFINRISLIDLTGESIK